MTRFYVPTPRRPPTIPYPGGWNTSAGEEERNADRICITGGASQNLACVLQVFSDPVKTKVWMVAPCYFLACRIFGDSGLEIRAVGEGSEGVDLGALERGLRESEEEQEKKVRGLFLFQYLRRGWSRHCKKPRDVYGLQLGKC
jgi:DNA-binding transcriptional MocR family regulator